MKYIILCNGDINDYGIIAPHMTGRHKLVCCDGGTRHAYKIGAEPDLIIGDLDSADKNVIEYYREKGVGIISAPVEKDETDSELAVNYALSEGADEIILFGAAGSRLDHTLANCGLLLKCEKLGVAAKIVSDGGTIEAISGTRTFAGRAGDIISLIPLDGAAEGVTTAGLYYPLSGESLSFTKTRGVSNVFMGDTAAVTVEKGYLLIIRNQ